LVGLHVPVEARNALAENTETGVFEYGGVIYSFTALPLPRSADSYMASVLERNALERGLLTARRRLALHLAQGRIDRKRYPNEEALGSVLDARYLRVKVRGVETASEAANGWAFALAWLSSGAPKAVEEAFPPEEELKEDYCATLYRPARALFEAGKYLEALPMFKNLHDLRWADIGAYLDAAECFLRTGESEECRKLLRELMLTLGGGMGSDDFARAGDLFQETGDRDAALSAFRKARERFREGK
jgi:tetratricopeptide (TPR) repeat protein